MRPISLMMNQTRKNGKYLLSPENRGLLQSFIVFNVETDFIDTKILTKIEKLINKHLVISITPCMDRDIEFCLSRTSYHYLLRPYSKTGMIQDKLTDTQWKELETIYNTDMENLGEVAKKVDKMRKERCTVNGKIQNKELREKKLREEIKGALDPIMREALEKVTEKFKATMFEYFQKFFEDKRTNGVQWHEVNPEPTKEDYKKWSNWHATARYYSEVIESVSPVTPVTDLEVIKLATEVADFQSQSFFMKMADKLGGLVASPLKEVKEVMIGKSNPFNSTMRFDFIDGAGFTITNKIVLNTSPLGNPFYQFPCTFGNITLPDGKMVKIGDSEATAKKAFDEFYESK